MKITLLSTLFFWVKMFVVKKVSAHLHICDLLSKWGHLCLTLTLTGLKVCLKLQVGVGVKGEGHSPCVRVWGGQDKAGFGVSSFQD